MKKRKSGSKEGSAGLTPDNPWRHQGTNVRNARLPGASLAQAPHPLHLAPGVFLRRSHATESPCGSQAGSSNFREEPVIPARRSIHQVPGEAVMRRCIHRLLAVVIVGSTLLLCAADPKEKSKLTVSKDEQMI